MRSDVVLAIEDKIREAKATHKDFPTHLERAALILNEEAGEVSQAVLDFTRLSLGSPNSTKLAHVIDEVLETVAVGVMMLEVLVNNRPVQRETEKDEEFKERTAKWLQSLL